MSLSFEDSLKNNEENNAATINETVAATNIDDENIEATPVMAYSMRSAAVLANSDNWTPIENKGYRFYDNEYDDANYSNVDELKNIILDSSQFNITQEKNSQYIPFQMPRYYDGFDLTKTKLSIYYVNSNKNSHSDTPVDVYYNDDYIRFAWLVSEFATKVAGVLQFEIHADGENSKREPYTWKSKSINKLQVIQSLEDVAIGEIGLSEDEIKGWYNQIEAESQKAQTAASNAQYYANEAAKTYRNLQNGIADEVQTAIDNTIDGVVDEAISAELVNYYTKAETYDRNAIDTKIEAVKPVGYATIDYVDEQIESIDVTEQLGDYALKTDVTQMIAANPQDFATNQDVADAIAAEDITSKLGNYYTKSETYSKSEVDTALDNVNVDLTGYATETYVDGKIAPLSSSVSTNTGNISSLSTALGDLQDVVNAIDTSPRKTYDIVYNDAEDENSGENVLVFYEIENENKEGEVKSVKRKYTITGGSGGSASANALVLYYDTDQNGNNITSYTFTAENFKNKEAVVYYDFSGTDSAGDSVPYANGTWQVRKGTSGTWATIKTESIYPNTDIPFNVSEYISSAGTYSLRLSVSDDTNGYASKTWTIQYIDFRIESSFNDTFTYPIGTISFDYTPYGAISKDIYFILDGKEIGTVTTTSSGLPLSYTLPEQEHGSHLLEVYMTAEVNGSPIESNHIVKDIIWYDSSSSVPVISTVYQTFTARQYDATNIEYTVYDPTTETPTVEIAVDDVVISTPTLSETTNIYSYKTDVVGEHIITITCGETVKTLKANITKLNIDIAPVTAGLAFDFNPSGKSNNDADRVWTDGTVSMSVSDNFDWINGGYQFDENGDQYFCIKAGTSAEIDYRLFADDAKKNGKEMKLVFKTTNVAKPDATFLHCMDNTTDSDHIGIQMDVHEAFIYGQAGKLDLSYSEEDIIEFEFNISKNTEAIPMVMGYEDGVSTRPMVYDDSYNFTQNTPKVISLGSEDCDLHIYRFKVYNTSLTDRGILNNFIADARNAEEMVARYDRNQIYDENQNLDPDVLAEKCPWLRVYKISAPYFTNNKSDKVPYTTIQQIYKDGDPVLDNWTCYDCSHSGQGTSSNNYGAAGRNLDFIMNKSQRDGVKPYFILGDGSRETEITMTRTSVPVAYLNAKVNIASSNNMTNAMLANRYNEFQPYNRPFIRTANLSDAYSDEEISKMTEEEQSAALAKLQEKVDAETSYIKDTMFFQNCVIFIQETNEDISTHREFADNNYHFYAIGNIGDSKKSDASRLTDMDDKYECCVEIMDVELPLSDFPVDTMYNAMGYKEDETTHERTYTWAKNENLGILYEKIDSEYVLTTDTEVDLNKTYYVDILEHDDFSEDFTYGWRYLYEGDDEEENAEVFNYCKQKWIELYRFITTSTDEEFKNRFDEYFIKDTALYYFLFAMRYCLADNLAKNSFWHYAKTGEVDAQGNPIRKWDLTWGYDMDKN